MDGTGRRRILVAVTPLVLEGALAAILASGGRDEVVQFHELPGAAGAGGPGGPASFDAAIVTAALPPDVRADMVIVLPDTEHGSRTGRVRSGAGWRDVPIATARQVLDLLVEQFP